MTLKTWALCATIMTTFAGFAQTATAQNAIPVNFPPADFTGAQFVDNSGCAFVRAGFDGNVTWVQRVSRKRVPVCGMSPTFGKAAPAPVAVAAAPAAQPPVQITLDPTPVPAPIRRAAPEPAPMRTVAASAPPVRRVAPAPRMIPAAPVVIKAPASKPIDAEPPRVLRRMPVPAVPSEGGISVGQRIVVGTQLACEAGRNYREIGGKRVAVRCGPQAGARSAVAPRGGSWQDSNLSPQTRIVPRHVYESRDTQVAMIPAGYKPAWEDDRLNPYRAIQTVEGYMATQQIWSNTVPRRLLSEQVKPMPFPANLWTRKYKHQITDPLIAYRADETYPPVRVQTAYAEQARYRTDVISSKGSSSASGGGYVQIGLFSTQDKADLAAARLHAAGFPVQMATVRNGGTAMKSLRVGPYGTATAVEAALSAVQGAGYAQAYIR